MEKDIEIKMTKGEAEKMQMALSDVLCWVKGAESVVEDRGNSPFLVMFRAAEDLIDLNIKLKNELRKIEASKLLVSRFEEAA
ncbi:hypothetical protein AAIR98_001447 [Elusimicrobium simillimum]|uniref:hypothetical protein n=1 Tax=Elusimicrobium simillimum TaxID=3143438 RepID=UPI003C70153F